MIAAPFFDGTYQPVSSRPSLVVTVTSSYAVPRCAVGTSATATCVVRYAKRDREGDEVRHHHRTHDAQRPPAVPAEPVPAAATGPPEQVGAQPEQHQARRGREEAGVVVAGRPDRLGVVARLDGARRRARTARRTARSRRLHRPAPASSPRQPGPAGPAAPARSRGGPPPSYRPEAG